jgi:hypothetical protein
MSPSPPSAVPVPAPVATALYLRSVLSDLAHKLVRRRKRTSSQVQADYDGGEWRDFLEARSWETAPDLEAYVYTCERRILHAQIDGRLQSIPVASYYRYRARRLISLLSEFDLGVDRLLEVGSGAGRNLFAAATARRWRELRGLELSRTGNEVVSTVARHFSLDTVSAGPIDLLDRGSPGFAELPGAVAFTHYCLEQLPSHTEAVLTNLADAGVRRVIHIEPTLELFSHGSLRDLASIAYIWRQNYLADLITTARRLEKQGVLRIVEVRRLDFAPTLRNTPTLLVWEPVAR